MMQDIEARKAKPKDKPYKLTDERGLYLLVNPNGGKLWRMNHRHEGKRKALALGAYPDVTLAAAREKREEARKLLHVFPHARNRGQTMSRESIRAALIRMGYGPDSDTPMTAHGFRGMASTLLHEQGWPTDVIERQLAHAERNKIKAAYNHAEHLPERRRMIQAWADYLDGLKNGAQIIPFRKNAAG